MKDLIYIFQFKSSFKYKALYIYSLIIKVIGKIFFGTFKSSYINTNKDYFIENENGKYKIFEPSDMHAILKTHNEEEIEQFFTLNGGIFLDIGGNVGKYSILIGKQNKNNNVITFEPNPNLYNNYLSENIKLNNLSNINLVNQGLSSIKGELTLNIPLGNDFGSASLVKNKNIETKEVNVKLNTLDNFINEENISLPEIKLIKIDVEGFELNVLKGGLNTFKNITNARIIIEITQDYNEINDFLIKLGFKVLDNFGINYIYEK